MIVRLGIVAAVIAGVVIAVVLITPDSARTVVFEDRGSSDSLRSWSAVQSEDLGRVGVASDPAGGPDPALRFEVRGGDTGPSGAQSAQAQLAWWGRLTRQGEENRYSWSNFIPGDYPVSDRSQELVQWKNEGPGSPPLTFGLRGRCLTLRTGPQDGERLVWATPVVLGRWLDFRARVRWSPSTRDGRVWLDYRGRRVLNGAPVATMYPGRGNFLRLGLTRDPQIRSTAVVFARDVKIESLRPADADRPGQRRVVARACGSVD